MKLLFLVEDLKVTQAHKTIGKASKYNIKRSKRMPAIPYSTIVGNSLVTQIAITETEER